MCRNWNFTSCNDWFYFWNKRPKRKNEVKSFSLDVEKFSKRKSKWECLSTHGVWIDTSWVGWRYIYKKIGVNQNSFDYTNKFQKDLSFLECQFVYSISYLFTKLLVQLGKEMLYRINLWFLKVWHNTSSSKRAEKWRTSSAVVWVVCIQ